MGSAAWQSMFMTMDLQIKDEISIATKSGIKYVKLQDGKRKSEDGPCGYGGTDLKCRPDSDRIGESARSSMKRSRQAAGNIA